MATSTSTFTFTRPEPTDLPESLRRNYDISHQGKTMVLEDAYSTFHVKYAARGRIKIVGYNTHNPGRNNSGRFSQTYSTWAEVRAFLNGVSGWRISTMEELHII